MGAARAEARARFSRVAQWKSARLLTAWSQVRSLPLEPIGRRLWSPTGFQIQRTRFDSLPICRANAVEDYIPLTDTTSSTFLSLFCFVMRWECSLPV